MLAGFQALLGDRVVQVVWQHDEHGVHLVEDGAVVRGDPDVREMLVDLPCPGLVDVDGRHELQPVA